MSIDQTMSVDQILGIKIDYNTDISDVKKQYHVLATIYHPDKNNGDEEKFKLLQKAYESAKKFLNKKKKQKKSEREITDDFRDKCPNVIKGRGYIFHFPEKISIGFHREWNIWLNDPIEINKLSELYKDLSFEIKDKNIYIRFKIEEQKK